MNTNHLGDSGRENKEHCQEQNESLGKRRVIVSKNRWIWKWKFPFGSMGK
jgi:hypothetical protein